MLHKTNFNSIKFRVPLSLVSLVVVTYFVFSIAIGIQTNQNLHDDLGKSLSAQAHALTPILTNSFIHDDVWAAYTALRGGRRIVSEESDAAIFHLVLGMNQYVFVTDRPLMFPIQTLIAENEIGRQILDATSQYSDPEEKIFTLNGRQILYMPLRVDDEQIANLIIAGPRNAITKRLTEILSEGFWVMLALLLILTPVGWFWGNRLVSPLVELTGCMRKVGKVPLNKIHCPLNSGLDEIGHLADVFQSMLTELNEKQELERQVVVQERLAAVGRISAGVAHEINNPLTGMLVSIDTYKVTTDKKKQTEKTINLIERGLHQIQATVSALLVECRVEQRECSIRDIDDIYKLAKTGKNVGDINFKWKNRVTTTVSLPATAIRQILLNLTLNAIHAAAESSEGFVEADIYNVDDSLYIRVTNNGPWISNDDLKTIFEPFHEHRSGGSGLGLWVTYQLIDQLKGTIEIDSDPARTIFLVSLPYSKH